MNDIYEEINQIKADIDQRIKHPYLMKFIDVPVIDEQKLFLLYLILRHSKLSKDKLKQSMIATMLVQIALDTHELVAIHHIDDEHPMMKNRQLTVLAGDYYSGLYYYLLALVDDNPMIELLSNAIKEINEYKISVYQQDIREIEDLMNSVANIDSLLIQKVAQYVHNIDLETVSKDLLLVSRLNNEKKNFEKNGFSIVIDGINSILNTVSSKSNSSQALSIMDAQMKKSIHDIETILQEKSNVYGILSEKVKDFIEDLDFTKEVALKEG